MTATETSVTHPIGVELLASERMVLGAVIESAARAEEIAGIVRPEHFYRPAHQMIFEAALRLVDAAAPVDPVSVLAEMSRAGTLDKSGGGAYLHEVMAMAPAAAGAMWHARRVRGEYQRRCLAACATYVGQLAADPAFEADTHLDRAREAVDSATAVQGAEGVQSLDDLLLEVIGSLESQEARGIPVPWIDLNDLISGLAPGELDVLAGRPGTGKSAAGLNVAAHIALREGLPALVCSMEMSRQEIMLRLIAAEGRVPLICLLKRQLTDVHWDRVNKAKDRILGAPLVIDDSPGCSVAHIRARLRGMARARPAALVFVDYLQLLTSPVRAENRQVAVAENTTALKRLAGEFGIPVLAAAQLNRASAHRSDRRPELSDLRESGQIEQDASVVVLLHREDTNGQESPRAGEIDFIVAKNRSGPVATVTMAFQGEYARCVDMAPSWTPSSALKGDK